MTAMKILQEVLRRLRRVLQIVSRRGRASLRRGLAWPDRLPDPVRRQVSEFVLRRRSPVHVPVDRLLLGNQAGMDAARFASATDRLLWASTLVADGPHAQLLRAADERQPDELSDTEVLDSAYASMARDIIRVRGRYFDATNDDGILVGARRFIAGHQGRPRSGGGGAYASGVGDPILVAPVAHSTYFQVLDGHHRVASAIVGGAAAVTTTVKRLSVSTPLQQLLSDMSWIGGQRELYQPVDAPEIRDSWTLVRRCTDRLAKMDQVLAGEGLLPPATTSYLDIASCYGWFVDAMRTRGYDAFGIERDPLALTLGHAMFDLPSGAIRIGDCEVHLSSLEQRFDVVSCFSLVHHFVLGRGSITAAELLRRIDAATGRVLFVDMGQGHEEWFQDALAGWDSARVLAFLQEHTSFDRFLDLGPDDDTHPPFERNYSRTMFACIRD